MEPFLSNEKAQRDYQLVIAARDKGDQRAYADLMRYYREPIYLMLLRMTHSPVAADDLTMEAFSKAFCQLSTYTPQNTFATWLFAIASNHGIDFIRRQHMRLVSLNSMSVTEENEAYEFPIPSDDPNPEEELITRQRDQLVRSLVDRLAPRYRRIVSLRYFDELSYEEIARQLNLPLGTVKIQLRRARILLGEIIHSHKQNL